MKFLFLFMDGVGLGADDPKSNPLSKAKMPNLHALLGGQKMVAGVAPLETQRASLLALDAGMGVPGLPQSATGQAALVTGKNVPAMVGEHYGPKPNPPVAEVVRADTVFSRLQTRGYQTALLNAYPERYFEGINSGRRLYSTIPLAVTSAGLHLKTAADLHAGQALSADFTGEGWHKFFKDPKAAVMSPNDAGRALAALAKSYDFAFFEYWPSDYAGHRQDKDTALDLLESFDGVLGGLLDSWDDEDGLILLTSDHGNIEDLSTRRHTANPVPGLVIGAPHLRQQFCANLHTLADITPAILELFD